MLEILVTYTFDSQEDRDLFYGEIERLQIRSLCEAEAGCGRYEYFFPCQGEKTLFLMERWESLADQERHMTQPHFALIGALKKQYRASSSAELWECKKL